MNSLRDERGQSSVEFAGVLPLAVLAVLVVWQLVLAGHAVWLTGNAARVAARAEAVGADPRAAARSAVPAGMRSSLAVRNGPGGHIRVRLRVPLLLREWRSPFSVSAAARLEAGS